MQALSRFFTRLGVGGTLLGLYGVFWFGPAQGADFRYEIRPGDTIISVSQRFLQNPKQYWRVQQHNKISNVFALQPGSTLAIPADLLRREPADAKTIAVSGTATLRDGASSTPLQVGTLVKPGSSVITGSDGSAALELPDLSILRIPPGSELRFDQVARLVGDSGFITLVRLISGRVETAVKKLVGGSRFDVATPSSAAGVRGTEFRVSYDGAAQTARSEVLEGSVAFDGIAPAPMAAGPATRNPGTTNPRSVVLDAGSGSVVDKSGIPLPPRALLGAPTIALDNPALQERPVVRFPLIASSGAVQYRAQIATDATMNNIIAETLSTTPEAKFTGLTDGSYVVRVRAIDSVGLEGQDRVQAFMLKARPEPPIAQAPPPKGKARGETATFVWGESTEGNVYRFELARDAGFKDLLQRESGLKAGTITSKPLAPGLYYWRIGSTRGDGDNGPWGDAQSFTMLPASAPPQANESASGMQFAWSGEAGQRFLFQIARDTGFVNLIESVETSNTSHTIKRPAAGVYFMRLRATDADGFVGPFTPAQRFEVLNQVNDGTGGQLTTMDGKPVRIN